MDKKIYKLVHDRANGICAVCHQYYGNELELHHILRRKIEATTDNCIMICPKDHRGTNGVHGKNGHILDLKLKIRLQNTYFNLNYTEDEVRKLMSGRLYFATSYRSRER